MVEANLRKTPHQPEHADAYKEFIRLAKELQDAKVPTENRVMYYRIISWWRHPIKRWRQIREIKKLTQ
jgi:hypothetical protein